jgi:hypothetical protein
MNKSTDVRLCRTCEYIDALNVWVNLRREIMLIDENSLGNLPLTSLKYIDTLSANARRIEPGNDKRKDHLACSHPTQVSQSENFD